MVAFERLVRDAWRRVDRRLAVVPAVTAALQFDKVSRVLGFHGAHFGVNVRFPTPVTDAWTFVNLPGQGGVAVHGSLALLAVLVVVHAALVAGYLGSAHRSLRGRRYDFAAAVSRYGPSLLGYQALVVAAGLLVAGPALLGGAGVGLLALLVAVPAYLVFGYLFFATPYLVVVSDLALGDALARSYDLAVAGGDHFDYAWKYFATVGLVSLAGTAVVVNLGAVGVALGVVAGAPVGLALDAATLSFLADYDEP